MRASALLTYSVATLADWVRTGKLRYEEDVLAALSKTLEKSSDNGCMFSLMSAETLSQQVDRVDNGKKVRFLYPNELMQA